MTSRLVTICLLLQVATPSAIAATATTPSTQVSTPISTQLQKKKYSLSGDISYSSNLREDTDPDRGRSMYVGLSYGYEISRHAKLSVLAGIEQNLVADTKTALSNTQITLARNPVKINADWAFRPSLFANLPTNQEDRDLATLQGGTGLSLGLDQKFALLSKNTTVSYGLSGLKNYHEYDRTNMRSANISHRVRYSISSSTTLNEKFSFVLSSYYQTGWTYDNSLRTQFGLRETLSYNMDKQTNVFVSHVNAGSALKSNGIDSNVSVYDKNASAIELGLMVSY